MVLEVYYIQKMKTHLMGKRARDSGCVIPRQIVRIFAATCAYSVDIAEILLNIDAHRNASEVTF